MWRICKCKRGIISLCARQWACSIREGPLRFRNDSYRQWLLSRDASAAVQKLHWSIWIYGIELCGCVKSTVSPLPIKPLDKYHRLKYWADVPCIVCGMRVYGKKGCFQLKSSRPSRHGDNTRKKQRPLQTRPTRSSHESCLFILPFAERRDRERARRKFPLRLDNRRHELIDPLISVAIIGMVQLSLHWINRYKLMFIPTTL